jgi:hypothetical protein
MSSSVIPFIVVTTDGVETKYHESIGSFTSEYIKRILNSEFQLLPHHIAGQEIIACIHGSVRRKFNGRASEVLGYDVWGPVIILQSDDFAHVYPQLKELHTDEASEYDEYEATDKSSSSESESESSSSSSSSGHSAMSLE